MPLELYADTPPHLTLPSTGQAPPPRRGMLSPPGLDYLSEGLGFRSKSLYIAKKKQKFYTLPQHVLRHYDLLELTLGDSCLLATIGEIRFFIRHPHRHGSAGHDPGDRVRELIVTRLPPWPCRVSMIRQEQAGAAGYCGGWRTRAMTSRRPVPALTPRSGSLSPSGTSCSPAPSWRGWRPRSEAARRKAEVLDGDPMWAMVTDDLWHPSCRVPRASGATPRAHPHRGVGGMASCPQKLPCPRRDRCRSRACRKRQMSSASKGTAASDANNKTIGEAGGDQVSKPVSSSVLMPATALAAAATTASGQRSINAKHILKRSLAAQLCLVCGGRQ